MGPIIFCYSLLALVTLYTAHFFLAVHIVPAVGIMLSTVINIAVLALALWSLEKWGMIK